MRVKERHDGGVLPAIIGVLSIAIVLLSPRAGGAQSGVEDEVRAAVEATYAEIRENLVESREAISAQGALQFWSSGGLMVAVEGGASGIEYEVFTLHPKHIEVVPLSEDSAAVMYYLEGSIQPKSRPLVSDYRTRVMEAYVREDGVWKARAGHWSPLRGGSGTSQASD